MTPERALSFAKKRFRALGSRESAAAQKAYMKSALAFHGVDTKTIRDAAREITDGDPTREQILAIARALFVTDYFDLRSLAIAVLERKRKLLSPEDAPFLVELARRGGCWAHVDYVATQLVDPLLAAHPALKKSVRSWAKDDDFWVRRVALLAELRALRSGGGDFEAFARIAAPMLDEREFFIRKAIGWVLREVGKKRPQLVLDFLYAHADRASGLTFREGSKYLPPAMKRRLEARRATFSG